MNTLRRIAAELSEADHRKNEFLAMLAHELRNPLAPIRNGLNIIELSEGNSDDLHSITEMMGRQVDHMVRLVDDLLDVSRVTRGKIELRLERVEISDIMRQAVENSRPLLQTSGHQLWLRFPGGPVFVQADPVRLAQVFGNLLNNSCKYSEPNGQVWFSAIQRENEVVHSIKDTGVGIATEMLPQIFELFTQIDQSLERSQGGLGIGLSLVRSLVEMHGGKVTVTSAGIGQGSEFVVRLPILAHSKNLPDQALPKKDFGAPSLKILVVDDNLDSVTSLAMLLKLSSNETRIAHDGEEAFKVAQQFLPHVILLDIGLPKLNGYEVARAIRREDWGKQMVLIALTGWGQDEDRRKTLAAGFDGHLVKPVDHHELKELFNSLISVE